LDAGESVIDPVIAALSDAGCVREINEDCVLFERPTDADLRNSKGHLLLVADGMGGSLAGEVASATAAEVIRSGYYRSSTADPGEALQEALLDANREVFRLAKDDPRFQGMGTTCVALALVGRSAYACYVGDSRIYLVRDSAIYLMTEDHSVVSDMVKRGLITRAQARTHDDRNVILQALGTRDKVKISSWEHPLDVALGDAFVLCSDGLHDLLEDEDIRSLVEGEEPRTACTRLVELAKQRGGDDNVSVIVALMVAQKKEARPAPGQTREMDVMP